MNNRFFFLTLIAIFYIFHYQIFAQEWEYSSFISELKKNVHQNEDIQNEEKLPKKDVFGLDLGIGSIITKTRVSDDFNYPYVLKESSPVFAVGFRYMHRYNSYISADFIKVNLICPFRMNRELPIMNVQAMIGIRGNTPVFFKTMSGYAAVRMGYGLHFIEETESDFILGNFQHSFAFESELGFHITRTFFLAFSYNLNAVFVDGIFNFYDPYSPPPYERTYSTTLLKNIVALRVGFNF